MALYGWKLVLFDRWTDLDDFTYAMPTPSSQAVTESFIQQVLRTVRSCLWKEASERYCGEVLLSPPHSSTFRILKELEGGAKGMLECTMEGGLWLPERIHSIKPDVSPKIPTLRRGAVRAKALILGLQLEARSSPTSSGRFAAYDD